MKKLLLLSLLLCSAAAGGRLVVATMETNKSFYPITNAITSVGEPIIPSEVITYTNENGEISTGTVDWEKINKTDFDTSGTLSLDGVVKETSEKVKANIRVFDKDYKVKVSTVGDSITYGYGIGNRELTYPKQLGYRLGDKFVVQNDGNSSKTLLENGNDPYVKTNEYKNSHNLNPDAVVIQLGTNDTKYYNFSKIDQFESDYLKLIKSYKDLPSKPIVYISLPPVIYQKYYDVNQENLNQILPKIMSVAKKSDMDISVINNQDITKNSRSLFGDPIHPNARGAALIANNVYYSMTGQDVKEKVGVVNASDYHLTHGATTNLSKDKKVYLGSFENDSWVSYNNVNFNQSTGEVLLKAALPYSDTSVEIRTGSPEGELLYQGKLQYTGSLDTYRYYNLKLADKLSDLHNIYITFKHPRPVAGYELARVDTIDFSYDSNKPMDIYSSNDLETAIKNQFNKVRLMADIKFNKNLPISGNLNIDLNGNTMDTASWAITKNESRVRYTIDLYNGKVINNNAYGSIYNGASNDETWGMNINIKNIEFKGQLFINNNVKNGWVKFSGDNIMESSTGDIINARNIKYGK